jgi:hypothetical protein
MNGLTSYISAGSIEARNQSLLDRIALVAKKTGIELVASFAARAESVGDQHQEERRQWQTGGSPRAMATKLAMTVAVKMMDSQR